MIESARYTETGSILAVIDGLQMTVPDDMGNRHRQMIAEWEALGNTIEPYTEPAPTVQDLLDYLGRKRVEVEEGGIVVNGIPVATDRLHSQVKITAAYVKAMADPEYQVTNWKVAPGVFVSVLNNATIRAIGDAVTAHVQACFNKEAELAAMITADPPTITTYEQIDQADWPPND